MKTSHPGVYTTLGTVLPAKPWCGRDMNKRETSAGRVLLKQYGRIIQTGEEGAPHVEHGKGLREHGKGFMTPWQWLQMCVSIQMRSDWSVMIRDQHKSPQVEGREGRSLWKSDRPPHRTASALSPAVSQVLPHGHHGEGCLII